MCGGGWGREGIYCGVHDIGEKSGVGVCGGGGGERGFIVEFMT